VAIRDGIVVRICEGPSCAHRTQLLEETAREHLDKRQLNENVALAREACFGRCGMGPNVLFERWRDGQRNEKAMVSLMMNLPHPDMQLESGVRPEELPLLIDAHVRAWRRAAARES
jgi:hypothetical protein